MDLAETFVPVSVLGLALFSSATSETFRFEFDGEGHLCLAGRAGWREPLCALCEQPIRWCLDMFSFTTGPEHKLAHARCVWTPEAFAKECEGREE